MIRKIILLSMFFSFVTLLLMWTNSVEAVQSMKNNNMSHLSSNIVKGDKFLLQ